MSEVMKRVTEFGKHFADPATSFYGEGIGR